MKECIRVIVLDELGDIVEIMESQIIGHTKEGKFDASTQQFFGRFIYWLEDAKRDGNRVFVEVINKA